MIHNINIDGGGRGRAQPGRGGHARGQMVIYTYMYICMHIYIYIYHDYYYGYYYSYYYDY